LEITFRPPLDRLAGAGMELNFSRPVSLVEVLNYLKETVPALAPYAGVSDGAKQAFGLLVWRNRQLLSLDDVILPADKIELIVMAAGG